MVIYNIIGFIFIIFIIGLDVYFTLSHREENTYKFLLSILRLIFTSLLLLMFFSKIDADKNNNLKSEYEHVGEPLYRKIK